MRASVRRSTRHVATSCRPQAAIAMSFHRAAGQLPAAALRLGSGPKRSALYGDRGEARRSSGARPGPGPSARHHGA